MVQPSRWDYTTSRTADFLSNIPFVGTVESVVFRIPWGVVKTSICAVGATYNKLENGSTGKWGDGLKDGLKTTARGTIQLIPFAGSAFIVYDKPYNKGNHYEWHGEPMDEDFESPYASYEGGWKGCKPQDHGTANYKNGDVFKGYFEKGEPIQGKMMYSATGDVYDGELKERKRHGQGTMIYGGRSSKERYKGGWEGNLEHGSGKAIFRGGRVYEGQWQYGQMSGTGVCSNSSTGESYDGKWSGNRENGQGTYKRPQYTHKGEFSSGSIHGKGEMTLPNGTTCAGKWKSGLLVKGTLVENGIIYKGEWSLHGHSSNSITLPTGEVIRGNDALEQIFGDGTIRYPDGKFYEGKMLYGKPHGTGIMNSLDGSALKGKWEFGEYKTEQNAEQQKDLIAL